MFARTERLLLRPGWAEDASALAAAIAHEDVAFKLARLPWPYSLADAQSYLARERRPDEADCLIFLRTSEAPRLIGGVGLAERDSEVELGYWIVPSHWGQGYATEAARAVVAYAQETLQLERLVSGYFADNPASGRVLDKLGFRVTGSEGRHCLAAGRDKRCVTVELPFRQLALAA